jgi:cytochrome c peroxidase
MQKIAHSKILGLLIIALLTFSACNKKNKNTVEQDAPEIPDQMPDYKKSNNNALAYLGRVLFYDKKLSSNNSTSCGSCHKQQNAFADDAPMSEGVNGQLTHRNSPTVFPKNGRMFWDGRANSLNEMVIMPITNEVEMNMKSMNDVCSKLSNVSYYGTLFKKAYGIEKISTDKISRALAEFVRNFDFSENKFKSSLTSPNALSADEKSGKELFMGKAKCSSCHHVEPDSNFGNPGNGYGVTDDSHNVGLDYESVDKGCGDINKNHKENGEFMMPVLLNIELTAPYMHDGRLVSLEDVVEHYNSKVVLSPTLDWRLKDFSDLGTLNNALMRLDLNHNNEIEEDEAPGRKAQNLKLTNTEKSQLVSFLKTLTDKNILSDSKFSDPFVH